MSLINKIALWGIVCFVMIGIVAIGVPKPVAFLILAFVLGVILDLTVNVIKVLNK